MSLHLGNLSARVRRDDLERVFRRFGRCNVQLKDGFGFVINDFPTNAEKALGALHGKNICGQPITLSWSNRQPRPLQRFARGNRSYEMQRGRNSARREDYNRKLGSGPQRDHRIGFKYADDDRGRLDSADMVDGITRYNQDNINEYIGEKQHSLTNDLPGEGDNAQPDLTKNDRWGERVGVPSNEVVVEGGLDFDRYEPCHDNDEQRDEDGNQQKILSGGSPRRKSEDRLGIEQVGEGALNHVNDPKYHQACYSCGELGHKMRYCPLENASWRKKLSRFDRRHDNDIFRNDRGSDTKKLRPKSRGRLHLSRDAVKMRRHKGDEEASSSRKHRRLIRSANLQGEEVERRAWRKGSPEKKRNRREKRTLERRSDKKARGPVSSPIHSDYTALRSLSHSESSKYASKSASHSKSRSVSSRSHSPSSRSTSLSTSQHSASGSSKSKARSRSRSSSPTSLPLSTFLDHGPLPSSPSKRQSNQKGSLVDATCPKSEEVLVEHTQTIQEDAGRSNSKIENMTALVTNHNAIVPVEVEEDSEKNHLQHTDDDNNLAISKVSYEVKNTSTLLLEKCDASTESLSPQSLGGMKDVQMSNFCVMEQRLEPTRGPDLEVFLAENLSSQKKKPDLEASARSCISHPANISSEELYMALKHYGLDQPAENETESPVEAYFASARLWPWPIIYYRKLRKGPISTENYARRIAQNQEFGIVDKYIRSSSGWAEMDQENS